MKCPHCKEETLKILGETYCPTCYKKGHKAHRKTKFNFKKSFLALGFGLLSLAIIAAFFYFIYNLTSNSLTGQAKQALIVISFLITFFVGGGMLYYLDRDSLILNSLIISVFLSLLGLSLGFFDGFDSQSSLSKTFFDIYLFLLLFITGAFIVDHYKLKK